MNSVLRNFFYAVAFTVLFALHGLDASTAQFSDLVRLAQSEAALKMVLALTAVLVGLDLVCGRRSVRSGSARAIEITNGGAVASGRDAA